VRPAAVGHDDAVTPPDDAADHEAYVERVLSLVERIPAGHVLSYGAIAEYIGRGGARQVGRVMALYGSGVPWWRVVRADGSLPDSHRRSALPHYREEGTPLRGAVSDAGTLRVDIDRALWTGLGRLDYASLEAPEVADRRE
jgi:alkylated DNA nucleotide flippase Atl1